MSLCIKSHAFLTMHLMPSTTLIQGVTSLFPPSILVAESVDGREDGEPAIPRMFSFNFSGGNIVICMMLFYTGVNILFHTGVFTAFGCATTHTARNLIHEGLKVFAVYLRSQGVSHCTEWRKESEFWEHLLDALITLDFFFHICQAFVICTQSEIGTALEV